MPDHSMHEVNLNPSHYMQKLQSMPFEEFKKYSSPVEPKPPFRGITFNSIDDVIFTTTEHGYPVHLDEIHVRGGIQLAVMGGVDPVLGQIAVADPDLTIMCDINPNAVDAIFKLRLVPLDDAEDGLDYWKKVGDIYERDIVPLLKRKDISISERGVDPIDIRMEGWSAKKYFEKVRHAWRGGKIKAATADIVTDGIELAVNIAKDTKTPIRLLYVSNIFDHPSNSRREFNERLITGLNVGLIDKDAQVIDASYLVTEVYDIDKYLEIK